MKKGGFLLGTISAVVLMVFLFGNKSNRSSLLAEGIEKRESAFEAQKAEVAVDESIASDPSKMAFSDMAMDEVAPNIEVLRRQIPTWVEIEREYKNYRLDELAQEKKSSREKIERLQLVEKANAGRLSEEETKSLMTEMRKQGVLTQLQLKGKVEAAKRKFL